MRRSFLLLTVVVIGFVIVSLETLAFRMLATTFGASIYVNGAVLGMVLLALAVGYYAGGRLADRGRNLEVLLGALLLGIALLVVLLFVYQPWLAWCSQSLGTIRGSLVAALVAFGVPILPLSITSPFISKMLAGERTVGTAIGTTFALSTFGSLLGVFLTTFFLIPVIGTRTTLIANIAAVAVLVAVAFPLRRRWLAAVAALALLPTGGDLPPHVVAEAESVYERVRVQYQDEAISLFGTERMLTLAIDEGDFESWYREPGRFPVHADQTYIALVTQLVPSPARIAILGLAAGVIASMNAELTGAQIDGVELDPEIVALSRKHMRLGEIPRLTTHVEDARRFLATTSARYDVIEIDTYRGAYFPAHLTTVEFFALARSRMTEHGALALMVGYAAQGDNCSDPIVTRILSTLGQVFDSLFCIQSNEHQAVVYATRQPMSLAEAKARIAGVRDRGQGQGRQELAVVAQKVQEQLIAIPRDLRAEVLTDDRQTLDQIVFGQLRRLGFQR